MSPTELSPPRVHSIFPPPSAPLRPTQVCQLFPDLVGQLQRVSVERISATTRIATNRESSDRGTIAAKEAEWEQVVVK